MSLIIPANTLASGGFSVDNSCRFNEASADSLHRATSQTNGSTKWTLSTWIKRSTLGSFADGGTFMGTYASTSKRSQFAFLDNDKLYWNANNGAGTEGSATTAAVFRDVSAWYHVVLKIDTTQSSQSDRCKIYVNNVEQSLTFSGAMPAQNEANTGMYGSQYIGASFYNTGTDRHFGGYLAETVMIDNSALEPDQFGEFDEDSGIWKPIDVSGLTFGTNGFYCDYKNSSALGNDANGSNNLTVTNLTAIDQTTDTPTNNFCTPNPLYPESGGGVAFSEGNLKTVFTSYTQSPNGTIGAGAGKWYYEAKMASTHARFGWCESHCPQGDLDSNSTFPAYAIYSNGNNGLVVYKNVTTRGISQNSGYTSFSAGKTLGIAFDIDNGKFYAHLNGTYYNSGDPANGTGALMTGITAQQGGLFLPFLSCGTNNSRTFEFNFGSPSHAISSGNTDGNGYGNFEYAVPSGYYSLNTKNLAEFG